MAPKAHMQEWQDLPIPRHSDDVSEVPRGRFTSSAQFSGSQLERLDK